MKQIRARTRHTCSGCGADIETGEKCYSETGVRGVRKRYLCYRCP